MNASETKERLVEFFILKGTSSDQKVWAREKEEKMCEDKNKPYKCKEHSTLNIIFFFTTWMCLLLRTAFDLCVCVEITSDDDASTPFYMLQRE